MFKRIVIFFVGVFTGILLDRWNIRRVLTDKDSEVERFKGNFSLLGEWLSMIERGESLEINLKRRGIKTIAVYGMGILGNHVLKQLEHTDISVLYIIDQKELRGIYNAEICRPDKKLIGVDAIIVTPIYQFENIKSLLRKTNDIQIFSIREIMSEGEDPFEK